MDQDHFRSTVPGKSHVSGQIIDDLLDPIDLEVHPAISVTGDDAAYLPAYVDRAHDRPLRAAVARARAKSTLSVLVGRSSTGKTRSCFEAIRSLSGWRIWHPVSPSHSEALMHALDEGMIGPWTVLWLNELQYYLKSPEPQLGERIAAAMRELLRDENRGPVLVLGTIWPDYWQDLTRRPDVGNPDLNAQRRALLTGHEIKVPATFDEVNVNSLPEAVKADQQVMRALGRTDKKATQFLAGGFELISRYEMAPAVPRALIDVAIDASRFGFGANIPVALLRDAAPDYVDDIDWNENDDNWLERAMSYAAQPSLGIDGPLSKTRQRSDKAPRQDTYRLADFLEENGRLSRQYIMPPESFWNTATNYAASAQTLLELAYQLEYRGRFKASSRIYLKAAERGDSDGWLFLADNLRRRGDSAGAEAVLRVAADNGTIDAQVDIAEILYERGDADGAKIILRTILIDNDQEFDSRSIAWDVLARVYEETGDLLTARRLLRLAANAGDASAAQKLAPNGPRAEKFDYRELQRSAFAVRQSRRTLERTRRRLVNLSARSEESFEWALQQYGAELAEEERTGGSADSLMLLGRIYSARGDYDVAETMFLKAINILDDPYEYGVIPALVELIKVLKKKGKRESAEQLWKYGLEMHGSISSSWNIADQLGPEDRRSDGYASQPGQVNSFLAGELPQKYVGLSHSDARSRGSVPAVDLPWAGLDDDAFERVLYNLLRDIPGYENVQWLMHTRAPDRGRDLSLDRFLPDAAGALRRERVIVQAKHWLSKSVRPPDITETLAAIKLWEPPTIRCLVIATSGRFTADAVMWIEKHNDGTSAPLIELWPAAKLEALLAERPELAMAHGLCV